MPDVSTRVASRAPSRQALAAHVAACEDGQMGYMDPDTGLFVMTSLYLRRQGECCGNACRHCPWDPAEQHDAGRDPDAPAWPWHGPGSAR